MALATVFAGSLALTSAVRANSPVLTATPNPVTIPAGQQTVPSTLTWDTGSPSYPFALITLKPGNGGPTVSYKKAGQGSMPIDIYTGDNIVTLIAPDLIQLATLDVKGVAPAPSNGPGIVKTTCLTDPNCAGALLTPPGTTPPPPTLNLTPTKMVSSVNG